MRNIMDSRNKTCNLYFAINILYDGRNILIVPLINFSSNALMAALKIH